MSKKKGKNNIPDEDLIKTILEDVNAIDDSSSDSEISDPIEFPNESKFSSSSKSLFPDSKKEFSPTDIFESAADNLLKSSEDENKSDDRTVAIDDPSVTISPKQDSPRAATMTDAEKTIAVTAFAKRKNVLATPPEEKVVVGSLRPSVKAGLVHTSVDASLAQAENLKIAQQRIIDLEKEIDRLRSENEELASAGQIIREKSEELNAKMVAFEKDRQETHESHENEIKILQGNLQFKDSENQKLKFKIEELESRLKNDFQKIRVRERELENRLELARAEKQALVRAKDDNILELQRKIDQMKAELSTYREKVQELNKTVEAYQDQMQRTVRALRLALTNLEVKDENFIAFKKAE